MSKHLDIGLVDSLPLFMLPVLRHCVNHIINLGKKDVLLSLKPSTGVASIDPPKRLQEVFTRMVNIDIEYHLLVSEMTTQIDFVKRVYTVCFKQTPVVKTLELEPEEATRQATDVADNGVLQQGKSSSERTASDRRRRGKSSGVSEDECDSGNRVLSRQEDGEKKDTEKKKKDKEGQHVSPVKAASWSEKKHITTHVYKRTRDPSINTETAAQELVHLQRPQDKKAKVEGLFPPVPPTLRFSLEAKNIRFAFSADANVKKDIQDLCTMVMTMIQMQQNRDITPDDVQALLTVLSPDGLFCFKSSNGEHDKFMGIVHLTRIREMILARYQLAQVRAKKEELIKETQREEALLGQDW